MEDEIDLRPYLGALTRYWWVILGAGLIFAVIAFLLASSRPEVYQASSLVTVLEPTQTIQFDERFENVSSRSALLKVLPELAKSDQLMDSLADKLEAEGIEFKRSLAESLTAQAGRDPILLYLRVSNQDPDTAARVANIWAELFVDHANEVYALQGESQVRFFEAQQAEASDRLMAANEALADFQGDNHLTMATNELSSLNLTHATILGQLNSLKSLRDEIVAVRAQQAELGTNDAGQTEQFTALVLQARALNLLETLPIVFQVNSEGGLDLTRQDQLVFLDSLEALIADKEESSSARLAELEPEILARQQEVEQLTAQTNRLVTDRDVALETYASLSRKLDEERIAVQDTSSGFRLASRASVPDMSAGLSEFNSALLGALFGMLLVSLIIIIYSWWKS